MMKHMLKGLGRIRKTTLFTKTSLSFAVVLVGFLVAGVIATSPFLRTTHGAIGLTPEHIGLGQGVAACFSSTGPVCAGTGVISYPVSWDDCQAGDTSVSIFIQDPTRRLVTLANQPCAGSGTLTFNATAANAYGMWIQGDQSGSLLEGDPAQTFVGPGNNCGTSNPPPPPPPPPSPSGTLSGTGCTLDGSGNPCGVTASWATQNLTNGTVNLAIFPPAGAPHYSGQFWWITGGAANATIPGSLWDPGVYGLILVDAGSGANIASTNIVVNPTPPGTVQGYKVDKNGNAINITATITAGGMADSGRNPYFIRNVPYGSQVVTTSVPPGYSTQYLLDGGVWTSGSSVTVNVPPNGAVNVQWKYYVLPQNPASISAVCSADNTSAVLSWPPGTAATMYYPRVYTPDGVCSPGWSLYTDGRTCYIGGVSAQGDGVVGRSITFSGIQPGVNYGAWVHSGDPIPYGITPPSTTFNCSVRVPNLTAGAVSPTGVVAGTPTVLSAPVTNIGNGSTGTSFSNFIQMASAANGGGTVTDLPSTVMSALSAGGTSNTSRSYTFATKGMYSARACADKSNSGSAGVIAESNESDNCGAWTNINVGPVGSIPPPSIVITPVHPVIPPGGSITVTWSCTNTTSSVGNGFSTGGASSGSVVLSPSATTDYSVTCVGPGGNVTGTVTVTVTASCAPAMGSSCASAPNSCNMRSSGTVQCDGSCSALTPSNASCPLPILTLIATQPRVRHGSETTLSWSAQNVQSCNLKRPTSVLDSQDAVNKNITPRNITSGPITTQTLFTLTCVDLLGGSQSVNATVSILPVFQER